MIQSCDLIHVSGLHYSENMCHHRPYSLPESKSNYYRVPIGAMRPWFLGI